ncbi:hypothetical protein [Pseudozobellia sp. WGM2]|uniref:hypothetical protein n=1 Tax=Pseudozobellia sp. WGM2 TaxID=2787625 RepID=UPI001ADED365|nr:hypothetical protein [Pseudozobellia sp. WGM2]
MRFIEKLFSWNKTIQITVALLLTLIVFSFYGLYTNTFPVLKPENFVFPILSLIHFVFLYVLWFKIKEEEGTDPQMKVIEFLMYGVCVVYAFNVYMTISTLTTYFEFSNHVIPATFFPMGILILVMQLTLIGLTLLAFKYRKNIVGNYNFDDMNQHIDSWE